MKRIKHRNPRPASKHWPFGMKLKPELPAVHRAFAVVVQMLNCPTCSHSTEKIARTLVNDYPVLLFEAKAYEAFTDAGFARFLANSGFPEAVGIDAETLASMARLVAEAMNNTDGPTDAKHLDRLSRHALTIGTTEDVLRKHLEHCFVCGRDADRDPHWFHYGPREEDTLLFSLCQRCTNDPQREDRICNEFEDLIASGVCPCCGERGHSPSTLATPLNV